MKHVSATIALWALAILVTLVMVKDAGVFTFLGPLYAVCMIGSVVVVKSALGSRAGEPAA